MVRQHEDLQRNGNCDSEPVIQMSESFETMIAEDNTKSIILKEQYASLCSPGVMSSSPLTQSSTAMGATWDWKNGYMPAQGLQRCSDSACPDGCG